LIDEFMHELRDRNVSFRLQSSLSLQSKMDCFAALAMTKGSQARGAV